MEEIIFALSFGVCGSFGIASLLFCLVWGRSPVRKKLRFSVLLFAVILALRFGGETVLAQFHMGWRCIPRYMMEFILMLLLLASIYYAIQALGTPGSKQPPYSPVWLCGFTSLVIAFTMTFIFILLLPVDRLKEKIIVYNDQTIVAEYKIVGGSVYYYYEPINILVHGAELELELDYLFDDETTI